MKDQEGNIRERTVPGVHSAVFKEIIRRFPEPQKIRLLDLGAGEGAMSKRLIEAGYSIEAVEIQQKRFQINNVPCHCINLNKDFAHLFNQQFHGIVAIEIIEHLENPRHFLSNCWELLNKSGILFFTSPNVECWNSRFIFLKHGKFQLFGAADYEDSGHITPIFTWQVDQISKELNYEFIKRNGINEKFVWRLAYIHSGHPSTFFSKLVLRGVFGLWLRNNIRGSINFFVLKRPADSK